MDDHVTFSDITQAAGLVRGIAHITPVLTSGQLDDMIRGQVCLKCENFQRTGAFKFRGAYHAVSRLTTSGAAGPVATISSGNHGQALALAASLLGVSAEVVMPRPFSRAKYHAVLAYGGHVIESADRRAGEEALQELLARGRAIHVHAFNDPRVIAGQGTIMLEFHGQVADLDMLLAPVGGGGLLSGLCVAGHHLSPTLKIFACEPSGASDVAESIRLNRIIPMPAPDTVADGLRTSLGTRTLPILYAHLEGVLTVAEDEIFAAMRFAHERLKIVIEPSSAVALAPILRKEPAFAGKRVGIVLTGGNVDDNVFVRALESGR